MATIFTAIVTIMTLPVFCLTVRKAWKEEPESEIKWNFGK